MLPDEKETGRKPPNISKAERKRRSERAKKLKRTPGGARWRKKWKRTEADLMKLKNAARNRPRTKDGHRWKKTPGRKKRK